MSISRSSTFPTATSSLIKSLSLPFHRDIPPVSLSRPHAFFLSSSHLIPFILTGIDKRFDNPFLGNIIFWFVFCIVGQPMGFLLYSFDIWKLQQPV
jgi:hypothetical protein